MNLKKSYKRTRNIIILLFLCLYVAATKGYGQELYILPEVTQAKGQEFINDLWRDLFSRGVDDLLDMQWSFNRDATSEATPNALSFTSDSEQRRGVSKMSPEKWGKIVVYPNLTATVLAEVTLNGKAVSEGSMVGAFVGEELRGVREVILAGGKSYVTLNVNLAGTEQVGFRVWEESLGKEFEVAGSMELGIGKTYGTASALVQLNVDNNLVKLEIYSLSPGLFRIDFSSVLGGVYVVEVSGDLINWKELKKIKGALKKTSFLVEKEDGVDNLFFRVQ